MSELDGKDLEELWDGLLSRDPERVRAAFSQLEESERKLIAAHLRRMVSDAGWHAAQRASARSALEILGI